MVAAKPTDLHVPAPQLAATSTQTPLPPVHHVWVINLENQSYPDEFGNPDKAPYLARTLFLSSTAPAASVAEAGGATRLHRVPFWRALDNSMMRKHRSG